MAWSIDLLIFITLFIGWFNINYFFRLFAFPFLNRIELFIFTWVWVPDTGPLGSV